MKISQPSDDQLVLSTSIWERLIGLAFIGVAFVFALFFFSTIPPDDTKGLERLVTWVLLFAAFSSVIGILVLTTTRRLVFCRDSLACLRMTCCLGLVCWTRDIEFDTVASMSSGGAPLNIGGVFFRCRGHMVYLKSDHSILRGGVGLFTSAEEAANVADRIAELTGADVEHRQPNASQSLIRPFLPC